ncbi:apolipoprotein N-acyltransferase [Dongia sedimenti]|uniref:Apolipoprotein N-acyltransferase n=1 Tax=Dongia sedimenti TaxID=3064282 RepID=A0ABU0YNR5_9PROT|nr:apolipoprotein N-acyltransferase [Rhodospirillaceae bacterium R-7]
MVVRETAGQPRSRPDRSLGAISGWRAYGLAAVLGALAGLGFAPLNLVPLFALGISGLVWLGAEAPSRRKAFAVGWWWGLGHFAVNSYWIAESFLVDAERFGWMIPPVLGGLAAYLALYPALATLGLRLLPRPLSLAGIAAFAAFWTIAEWLRGHVLTGYPWDLVAYIWSGSDAMMQSAALWGSWGVSLVTVFALSLPALFALINLRAARHAAIGMAVVLGALYLGGIWRLSNAVPTSSATDAAATRVRLVQPNIAQSLKIASDTRPQQIQTLMRLTLETPGFDSVKAVIWPESAANYLLDRDPELRSLLARAVPPGGILITGAPRGEPLSGPLERIWNSLSVINDQGQVLGTADKFHLVPLGEYVPMREIFAFINKITPGSMNFTPGPGPRTLHVPDLPPFSPLICYEVIFPGAVTDPADRPALIVNVTNDGWFGTSTGPSQHFATARFRSVEEGIPMLRAANTGISGVVDAYGRVETRSNLVVEAVIDATVPAALPPTPFARFGLLAVLPLIVLALIPILFRVRESSIS